MKQENDMNSYTITDHRGNSIIVEATNIESAKSRAIAWVRAGYYNHGIVTASIDSDAETTSITIDTVRQTETIVNNPVSYMIKKVEKQTNPLDPICIGFQESPGGGGFFLYHDLITGTTFTPKLGETLQEARDRKIKEFQKAKDGYEMEGVICPGRR